jgi:hypothetical protein
MSLFIGFKVMLNLFVLPCLFSGASVAYSQPRYLVALQLATSNRAFRKSGTYLLSFRCPLASAFVRHALKDKNIPPY